MIRPVLVREAKNSAEDRDTHDRLRQLKSQLDTLPTRLAPVKQTFGHIRELDPHALDDLPIFLPGIASFFAGIPDHFPFTEGRWKRTGDDARSILLFNYPDPAAEAAMDHYMRRYQPRT